MTLDLNCVRDTLLTLEEWLVLDDDLDFHRLGLDDICRSSEMLKHSKSSIAYTLVLLDEADFIKCSISYEGTSIYYLAVRRLTYKRHQFLDSIRPQSTWNKIHAICEKTGFKSLATVMEISDMLLPDTLKAAINP